MKEIMGENKGFENTHQSLFRIKSKRSTFYIAVIHECVFNRNTVLFLPPSLIE